ncbi:MAG: polysaccharide biosynthesis tyrosine autokinase [Scytolyngbya sp. HA4215-MV1]|jgi:capsular exopolysaccharide synthesis family protein|nr:polysaccharide biosynthesis tyrosine autokinase [Scytolyngbya sp. HA4215-MV1]
MTSDKHEQRMLSDGDGGRFQWLPMGTVNQSTKEDDEGGLNFGQVISALRRGIPVILGVTTVVTSLSILKASTSVPIYQAKFEILTKPVTVETQVISSVPQTLSKEQQASPGTVDETKLKLLKSPKILAPIVKKLQSKYPDFNYDALVGGLVVTPLPPSEILEVDYQDVDPNKVKAILKLVSEAYLDYSLEERLADVRQGIEFVETQLPQLQSRVEKLQDNLQDFRQKYNLIDPDLTSKQLSQQLLTIGQQRLETQIKLKEANALYLDLSRQLAQSNYESTASSALGASSRYQSLLSQMLEVESEIAKESSLFREDTPNIHVLRDQQQNLIPLLQREGQRVREEAASSIRELEARNQILAQTESLLNRQVKELSVISRRYTDIQRELTISTDNLNQFLTKREALRIDAGQRKTPWQILTPPTEPIPSAANTKKSAMLGVILGLLLGVGAALLLDKLSNVVRSPEGIKEISKLPILGVIPFNPGLKNLEDLPFKQLSSISEVVDFVQQMRQKISFKEDTKSYHYASSPFLEALRSLYINIRLLGSDSKIRSFVISSATAGEGKSTIATYLAQTAAALGQRVLLVDTDLRLPKLHERLALDNTCGLSHLISLDIEPEMVIQKSPVEPNLFVLTSGQVPPDPAKLLSSQKMQSLMAQFKEHYDLVIYDMPPLLGLADTKLIASNTDGIVMVVGLEKVKTSALSQAMETLKMFPGSILGFVPNGAKENNPNLNSYNRYYMGQEASLTKLENKTVIDDSRSIEKNDQQE